MKRFLALSLGSAVAVLMTVSIATAAPKDKTDDKKAPAPAHAEGTHHLQMLGEGLHGNAGFHYGNHYNAYTMHTGAGKHSDKTEPVAMSHGRMVTVLHGNAGFFYGEHYNRYTMHVDDKKSQAGTETKSPEKVESSSKKSKK